MRIVIVTYNWPPRNAIGTHRPYSWAKYWSSWGAEVIVLTAVKRNFDNPLDLDLPIIEGVKVIEVPFSNLNMDLETAGKISTVITKRLLPFLKKIKKLLGDKLGLVIDARDGWYRSARLTAETLALNADIVVSTHGPRASHLIASHMKLHNPNLHWVADYRDLWSDNHLSYISSRARIKERKLELSTVGKNADSVSTVSNELASDLSGLLRKKVDVVLNGFDISDDQLKVNLNFPKNKFQNHKIRILYTGLIYPGFRDPTPLFLAISNLYAKGLISSSDVSVDFYGDHQDELSLLITRLNVESFVTLRGYVKRDVALQLQKNADFLLLLESSDPKAKGVLTGKLFEYLASGTPIISLGSGPDSAIARVLNYCRSGICLGKDVDLIEKTLLHSLGSSLPHWFSPDFNKIIEFSRESQAKIMFNIINKSFLIKV